MNNERIHEALIGFLEKAQRPGLLGLAGKTVQKRCTKDLKEYFSALGKRIVEMRLESLAEPGRGISAEHARHAVGMRMHNLLRNRRPLLKALLHTNIVEAITQANKIHVLAEDDEAITDYLGWTGEEAAAYAAEQTDSVISGLDATSLQSIADAVSTGISERLGVPGTARLIKNAVDGMSTYRAEMIASTEMNDAMSQAFLKKLAMNAIEYKQWILGPNPCEICEANAEQGPIPIDEDFDSSDAAPPAHPNCLSGLELVTATGVAATSKRWFEGKVLSVRVETDDVLILTKNHPVLTKAGWINACQLEQGAELFQCLSPGGFVSAINPYDHLVEALLEEIPHTLGMTSLMPPVTMPLTPEDFHGDVSHGEVDIVLSAGFLEGELNGLTPEEICEFALAIAHARWGGLAIRSTFQQGLARLLAAPEGFVRGHRPALAFAGLGHGQLDRLAASANRQTLTPEGSNQAITVTPDLPSEIFRRLTGLITPVKITEICEHEFSGHVYNLQTDTGYYLANSIVTHNCVCALAGARPPQ